MYENNIKHLIKSYLGRTLEKKDRKVSLILLSYIEKLPFFKIIIINHPTHWKIIHSNIISHLVFQEFVPEQIIFNYGEEITGMYIILEGKVNIYHTNKEINKNIENEKTNKLDNNKNLSFSYQLTKGTQIGEECLKFHKKRINFAAEAATNCILGYLSKDNYDKILGKANNIEQTIITGFILKQRYFSESCYSKKLQYYIYKKFYDKNSYIFTQNSPFKTFYIIYKGSVNISLKLIKTVKCLIDDKFLLGTNKSNTERFTTSKIYELKGNYKENKNYNIINYEEGEIIGGIEFLKNLSKYFYTAKCVTDVELIVFNIKEFKYVDKIKKSENFKNKINEQLDLFEKRINNINKNTKKSTIFTNQNKFVKTFLENHNYEEEQKKSKYIHNIFTNDKINTYRPINFLKTKIRPLSASFKNSLKYKKKMIIKHKRNEAIKYKNKIRNKSQRSLSPNFIKNHLRKNNILNFRNNYTEISYKSQSLKKSSILNKNKSNILNNEEINKNFSNQESISLTTTNLGNKSSYIFPDKYNSERFNSFSTNLYFTSPMPKENKSNKFIKLRMNKGKENKPKIKCTTINLFKENKMGNLKTKYLGNKKLFIIRDEYKEKNTVSNILRNMFLTPPQNNKTKKFNLI